MADEIEKQWHLDRRVPIALILTIALQTSGIVWWASSISARVDYLERQTAAMAPQAGQIIRLETRLDAITTSLSEIKALIRNEPRPSR